MDCLFEWNDSDMDGGQMLFRYSGSTSSYFLNSFTISKTLLSELELPHEEHVVLLQLELEVFVKEGRISVFSDTPGEHV